MMFPIPLDSRAFALDRSAIAITIDLACFDAELWLPLVADGKHEVGFGADQRYAAREA